ncbi:ABC transporter substrate-binding protein [uncultured Microbacterium sp.]|uniref:ABC transporter substrate-binding protein n=1 Tax=uncultured Microbacterium sp. TaxID=191216 RepID=UPI0025F5058C|nr:extracellular solute-binding protein [uncultured Microbacterium sp.]
MPRHWSKPIAATIVLAVAAATMSGCGLNGGNAGSGSGNDKVQLTLWTHEFAPLQDAMTKKWIPEFEKANPGVTVKMTSVPLAGAVSYDSKLLSSLSSGGGPDVWDMGSWNFPKFKESGFLDSVDPKTFGYADDADLLGAYDKSSLKELSYDNKLYGMFSEFDTLATYYNTDVFAQAGIPDLPADKPVSWDQIGEIGQKLRQEKDGAVTRTGYQFGFFANFKDAQWYSQNFYTLLRQYGQDDVYVDGKPAGDTAAVKNALQVFSDFVYKYKAYDPTFLNNWFADVPQGRAAMVSAGTWYAGAALAQNPDFKFKVVPNPVVNPDDKSTYKDISYFWGWATNAKSDDAHKAAAQKFLAFILGKKGETAQADYWFSKLGYLQPSKAYLASDDFKAAVTKAPYLQTFIDALKNYQVSPPQHVYDEAGSAIVAAVDAVVYNHTAPDQAAAELQAALERIKN